MRANLESEDDVISVDVLLLHLCIFQAGDGEAASLAPREVPFFLAVVLVDAFRPQHWHSRGGRRG